MNKVGGRKSLEGGGELYGRIEGQEAEGVEASERVEKLKGRGESGELQGLAL